MKSKWDKIEKWFKKNNKEVLSTFNPGATKAELAELEKLIGKEMPKSFKEFYLIHNGQNTGQVFNSAIIDPESEGLSSISQIINEWKIFHDISLQYPPAPVLKKNSTKGIKLVDWNNFWVPIINIGNGDCYCMDLDPDKSGNYGQIIFRDHEGPTFLLIASSFEEWIDDYIEFDLD